MSVFAGKASEHGARILLWRRKEVAPSQAICAPVNAFRQSTAYERCDGCKLASHIAELVRNPGHNRCVSAESPFAEMWRLLCLTAFLFHNYGGTRHIVLSPTANNALSSPSLREGS